MNLFSSSIFETSMQSLGANHMRSSAELVDAHVYIQDQRDLCLPISARGNAKVQMLQYLSYSASYRGMT